MMRPSRPPASKARALQSSRPRGRRIWMEQGADRGWRTNQGSPLPQAPLRGSRSGVGSRIGRLAAAAINPLTRSRRWNSAANVLRRRGAAFSQRRRETLPRIIEDPHRPAAAVARSGAALVRAGPPA